MRIMQFCSYNGRWMQAVPPLLRQMFNPMEKGIYSDLACQATNTSALMISLLHSLLGILVRLSMPLVVDQLDFAQVFFA